jgi:penicillin-binding protein 1A
VADENDPDRPEDPPAPRPEPEKPAPDLVAPEDKPEADTALAAAEAPESPVAAAPEHPPEPEPTSVEAPAPPVWEIASPSFGTGLYAATDPSLAPESIPDDLPLAEVAQPEEVLVEPSSETVSVEPPPASVADEAAAWLEAAPAVPEPEAPEAKAAPSAIEVAQAELETPARALDTPVAVEPPPEPEAVAPALEITLAEPEPELPAAAELEASDPPASDALESGAEPEAADSEWEVAETESPLSDVSAQEPSSDPPPSTDAAQESLPPNYFRAAGDPDEPEEVPPSFWERLRRRAAGSAKSARAYAEPRLVRFAGGARAVGGAAWRQMRDIKHPRNVREAAVWGGWVAAGLATLLVGFFVFVTWDMPSPDDLWEARSGQSITYLDRNGNVILREGAQNAPPVALESLPPYVVQAFLAIEDRRFYDHWGVDLEGMMRAGAQNLRAGRVVQGGSTITQQLAKNLFLTNERSWRRKAQEIAMAIWLETRFTKEEILALYLSRVYFGAGAYGIEAAAERYFDRPARQLTLLQAAMIAGLVKAPSRLNPASQDIASARERAETVLAEMVALGFISDSERQAALREELLISRRNPAGVLAYYRDWIDPLLNDVIGTQLDDFVVETTLDLQAQRAGAEAVEAVLAGQGESRRVGQAALLSLDAEGGVIAMVGGRDYDQSQFNRVTQAHRQPGSSFKYFIYLAALENGLTPWSVREDAPVTIRQEGQPDWTPGNYEDEYHGASELVRAFQFSYNMVAIRVAHEVGLPRVIEVAQRLGVRSKLEAFPALSLGAQDVTLLEMTQAYGAMAAEGYPIEAHGVSRIRRGNSDETMWTWRPQRARTRVIEEQPLRYMNYMMSRVVEAGTGTRARVAGRQIGGKTGTANEYRDAWFIGYTPGIVTGVWVGNDMPTETARVTGGSLPADIWARFMPTALRDLPIRPLQMPGPDDYDTGRPDPEAPSLTAIGAPIGGQRGPPGPVEDQDRSLDLGPEG